MFLGWHCLNLPGHQSMKAGCPGPDRGLRVSESCPDALPRGLLCSPAEMQTSVSVMPNFEAEVRRGDGSSRKAGCREHASLEQNVGHVKF